MCQPVDIPKPSTPRCLNAAAPRCQSVGTEDKEDEDWDDEEDADGWEDDEEEEDEDEEEDDDEEEICF